MNRSARENTKALQTGDLKATTGIEPVERSDRAAAGKLARLQGKSGRR